MIALDYLILKRLYRKHRRIRYLKFSINWYRIRKIRPPDFEESIERLEDNLMIENLSKKELEFANRGLEAPPGIYSDWTDYYKIMHDGKEAYETYHSENMRFWAPFLVSTAVSIISLIVSIAALYFSLQ